MRLADKYLDALIGLAECDSPGTTVEELQKPETHSASPGSTSPAQMLCYVAAVLAQLVARKKGVLALGNTGRVIPPHTPWHAERDSLMAVVSVFMDAENVAAGMDTPV